MATFVIVALIAGLVILIGSGPHTVGGLLGAAIIFGTLLYEGFRSD